MISDITTYTMCRLWEIFIVPTANMAKGIQHALLLHTPQTTVFFFFALSWFYENAAVFLVFLFSISTETIIIGGNLMSALIKYTFRAQYNIFLWLFLSTFVPAVEAIPKDGHVRHISAYFWTSFRFFFWIYFLIYV